MAHVTSNKNFAVFVMTFQRNVSLEKTILQLFDQTYPPEKVLIIDNDPAKGASLVANNLSSLPVFYFSMGYNSGPAGAAKKGLELLAQEGYRWIGWIDDDDPPLFKDTFDILLKRASMVQHCGCVGAVGQNFDVEKALIKRIPDQELKNEGIVYVDNIAGNMSKIINAAVVLQSGVLPDESLFFGFEELDFDLRIKKAGYSLISDSQLYFRNRIYHNRIGIKIKRGIKKPLDKLWREYYSTRNLMFIINKEKKYTTLFWLFFKNIIKSLAGFKYGFHYGRKNFYYIQLGIIDFFRDRRGSRVVS